MRPQTAICLPLGSGSARVQPSAESVKTSFGGDVSKPPTRVALMHTAFPLCGSAGQFTFEQRARSIGMLSAPTRIRALRLRAGFPGGNPTGLQNWTLLLRSHPRSYRGSTTLCRAAAPRAAFLILAGRATRRRRVPTRLPCLPKTIVRFVQVRRTKRATHDRGRTRSPPSERNESFLFHPLPRA